MNYIKEFPNTTTKDFCEYVMQTRDSLCPDSYADLSFWSDKSINPERTFLRDNLYKATKDCVKNYFSDFGGLVSLDSVYLAGYGIIRQPEGIHDSLHYDTQTIVNDNNVRMRPFVCLMYLNDGFEGGQLIFPIQKKVIAPEQGKVVIFPASYLFPHQVSSIAGKDRYFARLNYMFNESVYDKDQDDWDVTKDGVPKYL